VLKLLEKAHTRQDFVDVVGCCREASLALQPTFVAFSPWTTLPGYRQLLTTIADLGLIDAVAPVQLAIRLLLPAGSRLLELKEIRRMVQPFDERKLCHPWIHQDPRVDALQHEIESYVAGVSATCARDAIFHDIWCLAHAVEGLTAPSLPGPLRGSFPPGPHLTEPWYCCAEPTPEQLLPV
jgi:hypothetical protein